MKSKVYQIKVLEKVLRSMELFDEKGEELTATQIHQVLRLNKSTTFRILNVLEEGTYLERDPATLKYRLGFKLHYLGSLVEGYAEIRKLAHPFLEELNRMCDETVQIVVLDRGDAFYLDKIKGKKPIRVASSIGQRLFAHCSGVGKVLLASLAEEEVNRIVREKGLKRQTCNTITDPSVLKGELARVRKRGYAIDNEESKMGLKCLAVPVSHSDGNVIAAISNAALKERFGKKVIKHFIPIIKAISSEISKVLEKRNFGVVH